MTSLLTNPIVGNYVREMTIEGTVRQSLGGLALHGYHAIYPALHEVIGNRFSALGYSRDELVRLFIDLTPSDGADAQLTALLAAVPRLMRLQCMRVGRVPQLRRLLCAAARLPSCGVLQELRHVQRTTWWNAHDFAESGDLSLFYQLPSMQAIFMRSLSSYSVWLHDLSVLEPRSSDITHLELRHCNFGEEVMQKLVGAPKRLKTFIYEFNVSVFVR